MKRTIPTPVFEEEEIWEKLYAAEENQLAGGMEEHSRTEGEDGEGEFDRRVLAMSKGKDVIDIGCGTGEFTIQIAKAAHHVEGVDFSKRALSKASQNQQSKKINNLEFRYARADRLQYRKDSFDLAISRRGPALDTDESVREAYRVLRRGGKILTQEIGERDKQNWIQVFGRDYPAVAKFDNELKKRLTKAGFKDIHADEFEANEYFATIKDVLIRLENSPIVPDFDNQLDEQHVHEIARQFTTPKGIKTNTHRVLVTARK